MTWKTWRGPGPWKPIFDACESPIEEEMAQLFQWQLRHAQPATGACTLALMIDAEVRNVRFVFGQYPIGRYRADFLIVAGLRAPPLVVECDGWEFHQGDRSTWGRDATRDEAMKGAGLEVVRFGGSRIQNDGQKVIDTIERALAGEFRKATA